MKESKAKMGMGFGPLPAKRVLDFGFLFFFPPFFKKIFSNKYLLL